MNVRGLFKNPVSILTRVTIAPTNALGGALARPALGGRGSASQGNRPISLRPASIKVYGRKELDRKKKKEEKKARKSERKIALKAKLKAAKQAEKGDMGSHSTAGPTEPKSPTAVMSAIPGLDNVSALPKPGNSGSGPSQASSASGTPQPPQMRKKKPKQHIPQQQQQQHDSREPYYDNPSYAGGQPYPQQQYGQPPFQTNQVEMMQMMQQMQQMQQFFQQQQGQQMPFPYQGDSTMHQGLNPWMNMAGPTPMFPNMPMPPFPMPGFPMISTPDQISHVASKPPRNVPSKESGGVPEPTAEYLDQAQNSFDTNKDPHHILLVIDLNGTLLFRPNKKRPFDFILRPHAKTFMEYCLENFLVVIWSSARPENVKKMVSQLLTPNQVKKCVLVWARDKLGLTPADYDSKVQCYKRLTSIWEDPAVKASHPDGGVWDQSNTVLVDDSQEKGRSEPYNILVLPEFEGYQNEPPNVLPQVHDYLNDLCYRSDVSAYMRQRPFGLSDAYVLPA